MRCIVFLQRLVQNNTVVEDVVDYEVEFSVLDEKGDNIALMPDHCHPNAQGYAEVWLPSVLPYFKKACGK